MPAFPDYSGFAQEQEEASQRFEIAKNRDPFPCIQPSLLNSADIQDYVRMTGMLCPFFADDKHLKSASYEAGIGGSCLWWDEEGKLHQALLEKKGDEFILGPNSIAFVQVQPYFRLPNYIALRFNLKIKHVHRGILLGTGPLVDPGFKGKLLIPLHNLTTNPYAFQYGEGLIWIEFTKTSIYPEWLKEQCARKATFYGFPEPKWEKDPENYLRTASPHQPIRSSIPDAVRQSRDAAQEAANKARSMSKLARDISIYGGVILLLTLATLSFQTWGLIREANKAVSDAQQVVQDTRKDKLADVQSQIQSVDKRTMDEVQNLRKMLEHISADIKQLQSRVRVENRGSRE